jgi:hypothetical protein
VTEKLDGSNLCMTHDAIYARSHNGPPAHPSFDYAKALHAQIRRRIKPGFSLFGEYCYAVHSISYTALPSYFMLFALRCDETGLWAPWGSVEQIAEELALSTVPVLWRGTAHRAQELEQVVNSLMALGSCYGPEREGVVVRIERGFFSPEFRDSIAKCVRPNHVQTDEHWTSGPIVKQGLLQWEAHERRRFGCDLCGSALQVDRQGIFYCENCNPDHEDELES